MARKMKESGVEWIGQIPEDWEVRKLKYILCERNEKNDPIKTREILSLTASQGVIPYTEKEGGGNRPKEDLSAYKLAYPDDIVMNSMNVLSGSVGLSKYHGCVSTVYYMLYSDDEDIDIKFYNYIFKTKAFQRSLMGLGNGILIKESENGSLNTIRMRIPMEKINRLILVVPDISEQKKIVQFLDEKIPEIDTIIEKTKESIEEYKKYKQAVITEAVTKGLDKSVLMKDSGIEWIGKIPATWDILPLKYKVLLNQQTLSETTPQEYEFDYIEIGSVNLSDGVKQYEHMKFADAPSRARRIVNKNDIIVSTVRTYLKAIAKIPDKKDLIVSTGFAVLTPQDIYADYLAYMIKTDYFTEMVTSNSVGVSYPAINASELMRFKILLPSECEQIEIAKYLDEKCGEIDALIAKKEAFVTEMENYKKSLIYEYVTGKKEVK